MKTKYRTQTQKNRIDFFKGLLSKSNIKTDLFANISPESGYYATLSKSAGISGIRFTYWKPINEGNIELLIERNNPVENEDIFNFLLTNKEDIENLIGDKLEWHRSEGNKRTAIRNRFYGGDLSYPETWPDLQDKMVNGMVIFEKTFRPYLYEIRIKLNL